MQSFTVKIIFTLFITFTFSNKIIALDAKNSRDTDCWRIYLSLIDNDILNFKQNIQQHRSCLFKVYDQERILPYIIKENYPLELFDYLADILLEDNSLRNLTLMLHQEDGHGESAFSFVFNNYSSLLIDYPLYFFNKGIGSDKVNGSYSYDGAAEMANLLYNTNKFDELIAFHKKTKAVPLINDLNCHQNHICQYRGFGFRQSPALQLENVAIELNSWPLLQKVSKEYNLNPQRRIKNDYLNYLDFNFLNSYYRFDSYNLFEIAMHKGSFKLAKELSDKFPNLAKINRTEIDIKVSLLWHYLRYTRTLFYSDEYTDHIQLQYDLALNIFNQNPDAVKEILNSNHFHLEKRSRISYILFWKYINGSTQQFKKFLNSDFLKSYIKPGQSISVFPLLSSPDMKVQVLGRSSTKIKMYINAFKAKGLFPDAKFFQEIITSSKYKTLDPFSLFFESLDYDKDQELYLCGKLFNTYIYFDIETIKEYHRRGGGKKTCATAAELIKQNPNLRGILPETINYLKNIH